MRLPIPLQSHMSELLSLVSSPVKADTSSTFTDNMKLPVHRWFRYSAGFSAQWVESVITHAKARCS
jgi:hypothetical protein